MNTIVNCIHWILYGVIVFVVITTTIVLIINEVKKQNETRETGQNPPPLPTERRERTPGKPLVVVGIVKWVLLALLVGWGFSSCLRSHVSELQRERAARDTEAKKRWVFYQDVSGTWQKEFDVPFFLDTKATMEFRVSYNDNGPAEAHFLWNKKDSCGSWSQSDDRGAFRLTKVDHGMYFGHYTSEKKGGVVNFRITLE